MKSTITAIRAIGTNFANRLFYPVFFVSLVVAILLILLFGWLTIESTWWLLLFVPVMILACVGLGVLGVVKLAINYISPVQTANQRQAVRKYVDKLQRVSETVGTPKFVLLFQVVRDIAAPRKDGFIASLANDSKTLTSDFAHLVVMFRD